MRCCINWPTIAVGVDWSVKQYKELNCSVVTMLNASAVLLLLLLLLLLLRLSSNMYQVMVTAAACRKN